MQIEKAERNKKKYIFAYPCIIFTLSDSSLKSSFAGISNMIHRDVISMHRLRRALKGLIAIANFGIEVCASSER